MSRPPQRVAAKTAKWWKCCSASLFFAFHQRFGRPMTTKWREGCFPPRPAGPTLRKRSSLFQQLFAAAFRNSLSRQSFPAARLSSLSQQLFSAISHELWTHSLKEPYIAQPFCLGLNPCQKLVNIFQGKPCWLASVAENTQGGETRKVQRLRPSERLEKQSWCGLSSTTLWSKHT